MARTFLFLLAVMAGLGWQAGHSGNPVIQGWYADPEAHVFKNQYRILPVGITTSGVAAPPLR